MRTFALIGKTGTGKSFHALDISQENKIDAIIDDGLLIFESKDIRVLLVSGKGSSRTHGNTMLYTVTVKYSVVFCSLGTPQSLMTT